MSTDPLENPEAVARRLEKSAKTLARWRSEGHGPAFVKVGRDIRYRRSDVDRWLDANTVGTRSQGGQ